MMTKTRLEAFSDGVIAIIITIMVLGLPRPEGHEWHSLDSIWIKLACYLMSFIYVGIYWNNHHHMLHAVQKINGPALWANLHLLFWLSLFPYVTDWAGESHFAPVPMVCYSFVAFMCGVAFMILSVVLQRVDRSNHLLTEAVRANLKEKCSQVAYFIAVVAPLLLGQGGVWISGTILIGVALMWLIPDRRIEEILEHKPRE